MPSSTQPVPTATRKVNLSHAILTMLNSNDPMTESSGSASGIGIAAIDRLRLCDKVDAVDTGVNAAPQPDPSLDMAIQDWDALFRAVEARLRLTVGEPLALPRHPGAHDAAVGVQTIVLECVAALDHLHTALKHERARREQLELGVLDAQAALARALENSPAR